MTLASALFDLFRTIKFAKDMSKYGVTSIFWQYPKTANNLFKALETTNMWVIKYFENFDCGVKCRQGYWHDVLKVHFFEISLSML